MRVSDLRLKRLSHTLHDRIHGVFRRYAFESEQSRHFAEWNSCCNFVHCSGKDVRWCVFYNAYRDLIFDWMTAKICLSVLWFHCIFTNPIPSNLPAFLCSCFFLFHSLPHFGFARLYPQPSNPPPKSMACIKSLTLPQCSQEQLKSRPAPGAIMVDYCRTQWLIAGSQWIRNPKRNWS